jgi:hypothetical protein
MAIELQIENGDNQPLVIGDIKIFQAGRYIVSYLEKGNAYKLLTGDSTAKAPAYDLKFFTDSIRNIQEMNFSQLTKNQSYIRQPNASTNTRAFIIWSAIIIALILLSLLTWKMIGELNSKNGHLQ